MAVRKWKAARALRSRLLGNIENAKDDGASQRAIAWLEKLEELNPAMMQADKPNRSISGEFNEN